jgi:phosphoribosylformimino-5-aminoimidazole carboxamide ribotide isomerase
VDLYPAIDVRGGQSVRLVQGDFSREHCFGDPLATAEELIAGGARRLHLVDLDAARTGRPVQRDLISRIATRAIQAGVFVQVGGGVRSEEAAHWLFDMGVSRVVLGTAALERPGLVRRLARQHPGGVAVGLDHRRAGASIANRPARAGAPASSVSNARVALRGWTEASRESLLDVVRQFEYAGVAAVVVTDIGRDGTMTGPDLEGLAAVLEATALPVVASGGVASCDDLAHLAALERNGRRLDGAIVGMALRQARMTLQEALAACERAG